MGIVAAPPLALALLGPLEARSGDELLSLGGPKPRALLADLLIHLGEVVSIDRLLDDLWGASPPPTARHALEVHVSQLRKSLRAEGVLVTHPPGYRLELEPERVDARRFERLLTEGREALARGDPAGAAATLRTALELWRGSPLAEFTYEPFAQAEIARLEELHHDAIELRIDADLLLGRDDLVAELEALVAANPLREHVRAQLMLALYRAGRQGDALAAYRDARETLVEELGVEPSPELRALEAAILRQDQALVLRAPASAAPQRKLATILFADVVDWSALAATLDPETLQAVMRRYFAVTKAVVTRHGGTVEKFAGDAVMAVFGTPVAHEDDALRAARAAVEIREAVASLADALEHELGIDLTVRLGLASGEVVTGVVEDGAPLATGPPLTLAARLQQAAAPAEIAVDALTRRLTAAAGSYEPLGELELRGLPGGVSAFRLVELADAAPAVARRLDAPLVGRGDELGELEEAFRDAVASRELRAVSILGPAGIGKSRLGRELVARIEDRSTVLVGRCLPYGEGITFWPLREAIGTREAVAAALEGSPDADAVADRLALVLGDAYGGPAEEVPWAFRRFCEALATRRPLVLALDDLHWAEPALLDLVEHLATRSGCAPILLVCLAREELLEERPAFLERGARIVLDALTDDETDALADHLLAGAAIPTEARERIVGAAEGNPLFLEQLLAHAAETGDLDPPPTLRALLAARLDRLGPGERAVLERAAVVGREFVFTELAELLEPAAVPTAAQHVETLVRRGWLRTARERPGHFRFRHGLIHDSAYRATPKQLRADLHEEFADLLDRGEADDELIGYHLERAYALRSELGGADRHALRLAEDAGTRLGSAGLRAMKRTDVAAGANLLRRASALLPPSSFQREVLCELGVALGTTGDAEGAEQAFDDALVAAIAAGDRAVEVRARVENAARRVLTDPEGAAAAFLELAAEAIPVLRGHGDDRALGRAWMLTGWVHGGVHGRNALWGEAAERALTHYRRSGWPASSCLGQIASALYFGPTPVVEAIARGEALVAEAEDFAGAASIRAYVGGLEAMRGRFDRAFELLTESRAVLEQLGQTAIVAHTWLPIRGFVESLADDPAAAEQSLRTSCVLLERIRDRNALSTQAAELAEVIYQQGRYDEAEQWAHVSRENAASDDIGSQCVSRAVIAKLSARRGELPMAQALAREAVSLAATTDNLNRRARVQLDLGEVLSLSGLLYEADAAARDAASLFEQKGNLVACGKARVLPLEPAGA